MTMLNIFMLILNVIINMSVNVKIIIKTTIRTSTFQVNTIPRTQMKTTIAL